MRFVHKVWQSCARGSCSKLIPAKVWCRTAVNVAVATGIIFVARFLPYLSVVMSLVGAFLTITISVIFPSLASLRLHADEMSGSERAWEVAVIVVGLCCTVSGTASALLALRAKFAA